MRPNTSASGILRTKRRRPVNTSMFTKMLVPKPKNAFKSPGVHRAGLFLAMTFAPQVYVSRCGSAGQSRQHAAPIRDPAENTALSLDQCHDRRHRETPRN